MASTWQNPTNELTNYTATSNQDVSGLNCNNNARNGPEDIAWRCNQTDDCDGFITYSGRSGGCMILKSRNGNKGISNGRPVTSNGVTTYAKKSTTWRKAKDLDTTDPSILPVGTAQSFVKLFADYGGAWTGGTGGTEFTLTKPGLLNPGGGNSTLGSGTGETYCNDCVSSYCIPLGWKFIFDQNGNDGNGNVEGYYDRGNQPGCYGIDSPTWHGMNDQMTEGLIQNIGFDVFAHWDDMSTKGVVAADELLIKRKWCGIQSPSQLVANKTKCTGPTSSGTRVLSDTDWATYLTNACLADTNNNWANQPAVIDEMKTLYLGNQDSQGHIQALFKTFCRGDPLNPKSTGGHRTDVRCAAINADDFGVLPGTSNCFDAANSSFPGCATAEIDGVPYIGLVDLLSPLFSLPPGPLGTAINSANTNPGCLIQAGRLAATNGPDNTFPYQQTVCNPPNLQICGINVSVGAAQNSPIDASCNQTMINNAPPGSPGAAPPPGSPGAAPPPGSPGAAPPLPIPALSNIGLDTPDKQYGGIGGCICLICICFIMIIVLAMSGGGDEGGGGSTAALLASLGAAGG